MSEKIKSGVTISLVAQARGGPFIYWNNLKESCDKAAKLGFTGVEIFSPGIELLGKLNLPAIIKERNLQLAALATGPGYVMQRLNLCSIETDVRKRAFDFICRYIDFAGNLGAVAIIGSMKGSIENGVERAEALKWLREALEGLAARAAQYGVPLIIEPLNRYETNFINTLSEGVDLIRSLENDNIKLLADLFHMNIEEESIPQALHEAAPYLGYVHLVDSNRRVPGLGHIDFAEVAATLQAIDYQGYVTAEALPYPDPDKAADQTMKTYRKYFAN